MPDLADGECIEVKGSGAKPYQLRNVGGVYSCSCPAWRNQSAPIEARSCKHLRRLRGDTAEAVRVGVGASPGQVMPRVPKRQEKPTEEKAPPLLLAQSWDQVTDLAGWWMSEKLDGVRAYWDGARLLSRQGNVFRAPTWFIADLPDQPLDGELWLARGMFQRTVSIVRRHDESEQWKHVRYVIFDAPALRLPFEQRQEQLRARLADARAHSELLAQEQCRGIGHLRNELDRVLDLGGEGLMLRRPESLYEAGRSYSLVKVKTFKDAEATVVGHQAGEGKHAGRLGALLVEMPDGKRFSVGTGFSDQERRHPPAIGSLITYRYQELTDRGVPRFPTFLRIRTDLTSDH